jgi:hypothetical protein
VPGPQAQGALEARGPRGLLLPGDGLEPEPELMAEETEELGPLLPEGEPVPGEVVGGPEATVRAAVEEPARAVEMAGEPVRPGSEYRLQFPAEGSTLVSVPEYGLLTSTEPAPAGPGDQGEGRPLRSDLSSAASETVSPPPSRLPPFPPFPPFSHFPVCRWRHIVRVTRPPSAPGPGGEVRCIVYSV